LADDARHDCFEQCSGPSLQPTEERSTTQSEAALVR
jgi:hypothetical protein